MRYQSAMTGGEIVIGAAAKAAVAAGAALSGDQHEKDQLSHLAQNSKALEIASQAHADRVAIRQLALTKLFAPLARWTGYKSEYFANEFEHDIAERLADVPEEHLIEPAPYIAAQTVEGLAFSLDEPQLEEMYLSLLTRASDSRVAENNHPSFASVIKQLSSDESKSLLSVLFGSTAGLPMVRLKVTYTSGGYNIIENHVVQFANLSTKEPMVEPRWKIWAENWMRLGLVTIDYSRHRVGDDAYAWVEGRPELISIREAVPETADRKVEWDKGLLIPTDFGALFGEAVRPIQREGESSVDTSPTGEM